MPLSTFRTDCTFSSTPTKMILVSPKKSVPCMVFCVFHSPLRRMSALIKMIKEQSVFNAEEQLYVSKSKDLHQLLKALALEYLYDPILNVGKASIFEDEAITNAKRLAEVQRLKIAYCLKKGKVLTEEYKSLVEGIGTTKVNARELIIYPFDTQYKSGTAAIAQKTAAATEPSESSSPSGIFNQNRIHFLRVFSAINP